MAKTIRYLLYTLGGGVLLLVLAVVAILVFVDPNDYKNDITRAVHDATGRELHLDGRLELSVFPWLGLRLNRVSLGNAPGFGATPMASVQTVDIHAKLLPLLEKRLEMQTLLLRGLDLNLARKADGVSNWDDLAGGSAETAAKTPGSAQTTTPEATPAAGPPPLAALTIGGIELEDARIVWDDAQTGQHIDIDNLQLQTGALAPPEPVDIDLAMDIATRQPALRNHITLRTRLGMDQALQHFSLDDLKLGVDSQGEILPVSPLAVRLAGQASADLEHQQATLSGLQIDVLGSRLRGDIRLAPWTAGKAQINLTLDDPKALAGLLPPDLDAQLLSKASLTTEAQWNLDTQTAQVPTLQLRLADLQLDARLDANHIVDAPQASGRLTLSEFSPRILLQKAGIAVPETSDPAVLQKAALSLDFTGSTQALAVNNLQLRADDTTLSGQASVTDFAQPAIRYTLAVDAIDVDRYLPPQADTPPPAPAGAAAGAAQLPLEPLRALDVDGRLTIGQLKVAKARLADILLVFRAKHGQLRLHPAQAKLYQGSYSGDIRLDARGDTPVITLGESVKNVHAGPLLTDVLGKAPVSGIANLRADLTTRGVEPPTLMANLDGKVRLSFLNGAVEGINIGYQLRKAQAKLRGQPAPPKEMEQTDFAELSASADIAKGVVTNKDLTAKSPLLRVSGEGTVDLPRERLDYRLTTTVVNTATGQAGKELEQLKGLPIPIRIKGAFADPKISLDLKPVLDAKAKQLLEKKKQQLKKKADEAVIREREKLKEKAKEDVKKELDKALKGLFR